jgi:hypothetical protein
LKIEGEKKWMAENIKRGMSAYKRSNVQVHGDKVGRIQAAI